MSVTLDTSKNLVSLDAVKFYLQLEEASSDDIVKTLINDVSQRVISQLGYNPKQKNYTEYHDGKNKNILVLKHFPVTTLTSLHDDTSRNFTDDTLVPTTRYFLDQDNATVELLNGYVFSSGQKNVKVVYSAGYVEVPEDLQNACKLWIAQIYFRWSRKKFTVQSESIAGNTISYIVEGVPKEIQEILQSYVDNYGLVQ